MKRGLDDRSPTRSLWLPAEHQLLSFRAPQQHQRSWQGSEKNFQSNLATEENNPIYP